MPTRRRGGARRCARRTGFTLIEVLIAVVISSIVVTLAYATLASASETERRVERVRAATDDATAGRALLRDALRHAVLDASGWAWGTDAAGHTTRVSFVSRGIVPPLGATGRWRVTLSSNAGLTRLVASPLDEVAPDLMLVLHASAGMRLRLQERADSEWHTEWHDARRLPSAMEFTWLDAAGHTITEPLVVRTMPVAAP
jgi:prepilin-type N-terminal cleavage/methylation domain-containing protein